MTVQNFKELIRREKLVVVKAQSFRFRLVKYVVISALMIGVYSWRGGKAVWVTFIVLAFLGVALHFFLRSKTQGWTRTWGPYNKILINNSYAEQD